MNARATLFVFTGAVLALGAIGCGRTFEVQTPRRFVELEEESTGYDYRATTPDGVVVGVREVEVDPDKGGSLQFWVEAVEQRMRQVGGYALLEKVDVKTADGLRGKQLRFGRDEGSKPYRYWITLFLHGDSLFVIEAGGEETAFTRAQRDVERAIRSLEP